MTRIDFKLFFNGFKAFWEEVEELVYLVEGAGEKEGVIGLEGFFRIDWGDEFAVAVDFSEEEVVEVSEACRLHGFPIHRSAWNDFKLCGVLAIEGLVCCSVFFWSP